MTASVFPSLSLWQAETAALGLIAGFILGLAYFATLWSSVNAFTEGRISRALIVQALRFAFLAIVLFGLAKLGAAALLAGAAGIMAARSLAVRRARKTP